MRSRRGFSLIEVVLATLLFSVGALGVAATAAAISRQIRASKLRSEAALLARSRAEKTFSACVVGTGVATLDQTLERRDAFGLHHDRFLSAVTCF